MTFSDCLAWLSEKKIRAALESCSEHECYSSYNALYMVCFTKSFPSIILSKHVCVQRRVSRIIYIQRLPIRFCLAIGLAQH